MLTKKQSRVRRARKTRARIRHLEKDRLCVHRTPRHTYAQVISADDGKVLASASTLQAEVKAKIKNGGNIEAAKAVGQAIAEKAKQAGIEDVAFDRSGFHYHGRVKALADAARESGLNC